MKKGKIIVLSAPSGCGKSTIINSILDKGDIDLQFSVSATNRSPREGEVDGESYYFLSTERFKDAIADNEFVEWEQVYPGRYYGTLKREIERVCDSGHNIVLDIDVKGALNVKKIYGSEARTIFILPPSLDVLYRRLVERGTESQEVIAERFSKAEYEISFANEFDFQVVNDDLATAIAETRKLITDFISDTAE